MSMLTNGLPDKSNRKQQQQDNHALDHMSSTYELPVHQRNIGKDQNRTDQTVAPITRILPVVELCESVLQHLDFYDLIRVQQVCRDLNAAVKSSPICQTTLFYRAAIDNHVTEWVADYKNRLYTGDAAEPYLEKVRNGSRNYNVVQPLICNPALSTPRHDDIRKSRMKRVSIANGINDHTDRPHHTHEYFDFANETIRHAESNYSCRSMFLTRPPVTRIELEPVGRCEHTRRQDAYLKPGWCDNCAGNKVIANPDGVTVGQVVDAVSLRKSRRKDDEPDKIRFPGAFVVTREIYDWVNESERMGGFEGARHIRSGGEM